MDISVIEQKDKYHMTFALKGTTPAYANTIRRLILERVPTMAIEDVEFHDNSSILYDEIIAHRLGLIPLTTDLKTYNLQSECNCKGAGCARCTVTFSLEAKGPKIVYASEMQTSDPAVKPVYPNTPIVKLLKNQEIKFVAKAVLGVGIDHAKWSPGHVFYKYTPVITIMKECDNCEECVKSCPKAILAMKSGKLVVDKDKLLDCHLCGACVDACQKKGIRLGENDDSFIFTLESFGQLECKEILESVMKVFDSQLDELKEAVEKLD